ncbi:MAG: hypothetical protein V3S64_10755 [bacterium]
MIGRIGKRRRIAPGRWPLSGWLLSGAVQVLLGIAVHGLLGGAVLAQTNSVPRQNNPVPYGMVGVRVTNQAFDQVLPWNKNAERNIRGNAVVVEGKRLLTTADLVRNANLLEVRKFGRYPDFIARTVLVDYDLNLALLEVDAPEFWRGLRPLPIASKPIRSGRFVINRWRSNGRFQQGSGEVVDFSVSNSPFGLMEFPTMRGITAMEGLGWAEVLTAEGKVVGLITSHSKQRIQAINGALMKLLVEASRRNEYRGFAHRGFTWQRLNQAHMRSYFGLKMDDGGVLIRRVFPGGTGSEKLRPMDILHKVNGYTIDPEGKIDHPDYGSILFSMALNESLEPELPVEVRRDGKRLQLRLRRRSFSDRDYRIHPPRFDRPNDYEVFGGLVLQELSVNYLREWGDKWRDKAPARLVIEYVMNSLRKNGSAPEKVVIITRVLSDPANLGYQGVNNAILKSLNGKPIKTLADFRGAMNRPVNGYHILQLLPGPGRGRLVFRAGEMQAVNTRIRDRYGIPEKKR